MNDLLRSNLTLQLVLVLYSLESLILHRHWIHTLRILNLVDDHDVLAVALALNDVGLLVHALDLLDVALNLLDIPLDLLNTSLDLLNTSLDLLALHSMHLLLVLM